VMLTRSTVVVRLLATALTVGSFGGMTAYASAHVQNPAAPLQPTVTAAAAPLPAPRAAPTTPPRLFGLPAPAATAAPRQRISPTVPVVPRAPLTRTRVS